MRVGLLGVRGNGGGGVGCREEAGRGGERTRTGGSSATPALALREKVTEAPRGARRVLHGMQRDSTWRCHAPPATGSRPPCNGVACARPGLQMASGSRRRRSHRQARTSGGALRAPASLVRHARDAIHATGAGTVCPPPQRLQLLLPLPARVRLSAQTPSFATSTRGAEKRSLQGVWLVPGVRRPAANKHPPVSLENSSPLPHPSPSHPARAARAYLLHGAFLARPERFPRASAARCKAARHPPSPRRPRPAAPHALRPTARN